MRKILQPFWFALLLAAGIGIGMLLAPYRSAGGNKIAQIIQLIHSNYVDSVNDADLEKKAITDLLHGLDPHSNYFTPDEARHVNEPLEGSFEGIGIEFLLWNDTIFVANVTDDGPSAKAGMKVGDRIVTVDGKVLNGMHLKNDDVFKLLKGPGGSKVQLTVVRTHENKTLDFTIERGSIPIKSIDAWYKADAETGYIRIIRFAATTYDEYLDAFHALKSAGMKNLIIDLRDNGGGYLSTARKIADEFLDNHKKILTTRGQHSGNETFQATDKGEFEHGKLIVLINENSASASEILSGALQDNDRALIIGRRSFGKGLVQNSFGLSDGASIRLTISRYYTPSGRCIQKPYMGNYDEYEEESEKRYDKGELFNADSNHLESQEQYSTLSGRKVYGGGGIMPDIFVPLDTSRNSPLLNALLAKSILRQVAYYYVAENQGLKQQYSGMEAFGASFHVPETLLNQVKNEALAMQVNWNAAAFEKSKTGIEEYLKAFMARQLYGASGFYFILNQTDPAVLRALKAMASENDFSNISR